MTYDVDSAFLSYEDMEDFILTEIQQIKQKDLIEQGLRHYQTNGEYKISYMLSDLSD